MKVTRLCIKHAAEPTVYVVECDDEGTILAALDVTDDATRGGLCAHILDTLPLAAQLDELTYLQRDRDRYVPYEPDCGNVHHLMHDLLRLEREHRAAAAAFALADSRAKGLKKDMETKAAEVHELLARLADRKPLPLFDTVGV